MSTDMKALHDKAATLNMQLKADSGYESECIDIRISAEQWAVIHKVANSPDGLSRRLLDAIYNEHVKEAA